MIKLLAEAPPATDNVGPHGRKMLGEYLQRAATGDIDAFMAFYDATCGDAYRLACCFLGDRDEAADALVRTYVTARREVHGFDPAFLSPGGWLLVILQNELVGLKATRPGRVGP